jgi:transglutaminase-like putative cysteine protease
MPTTRQPTASSRNAAGQRLFDVDCKLSYTLLDDTHFLFIVHALDGMDQQVVEESLRITPALEHEVHADPVLGHRTLRVKAPTGPLTLRYRARVRVHRVPPDLRADEVPIEALPHAVLPDLMPTRYCESDRLASAASRMFGELATGYARVQAISDWIHEHVDYRLGSSNTTTTACDVFLQRAGVCRDFAHLGVAFCRALNIPARLVVGYARFDSPPPDFHAVFEAFLGGRWELFDPTGMTDPQDLVRIAVGRDAGDVAFATLFGPVRTRLIRPEVEQVRSRRARREVSSRK